MMSSDDYESIESILLPLKFYSFALYCFNDCNDIKNFMSIDEKDELKMKAEKSLNQARNIILNTNLELNKLWEKAKKRLKNDDGKVAPGSSLVQRSYQDIRFLLCSISILASKISAADLDPQKAVKYLKESIVWYPRSVEANYLLAETMKSIAATALELKLIEKYYRRAIETGASLRLSVGSTSNGKTQNLKDSSVSNENVNEETFESAIEEDNMVDLDDKNILIDEIKSFKAAQSAFALYLYQADRVDEARLLLLSMGYEWKLSQKVLNYDASPRETNQSDQTNSKRYLRIIDQALSKESIDHIQHVFRQDAPFWKDHDYDLAFNNCSKRVGYFSYLYPFKERGPICSIEKIIDFIQNLTREHFPQVAESNYAEWWVHSRYHTNGHQLHFDSDETELEEHEFEHKSSHKSHFPIHPIVSTVLYLTDDVGGPTLITDQILSNDKLATKGWMSFPKQNRLVMFDASYLHGVIPGKLPAPIPSDSSQLPMKSGRRLTFMVGFWKKISAKSRGVDHPGPGQPFPGLDSKYQWPNEMKLDFISSQSTDLSTDTAITRYVEVHPVAVTPIWECIERNPMNSIDIGSAEDSSTLGSSKKRLKIETNDSIQPSNRTTRPPNYNACFQGF